MPALPPEPVGGVGLAPGVLPPDVGSPVLPVMVGSLGVVLLWTPDDGAAGGDCEVSVIDSVARRGLRCGARCTAGEAGRGAAAGAAADGETGVEEGLAGAGVARAAEGTACATRAW